VAQWERGLVAARHTYRDSNKSVITHLWLLNIIYEQKLFAILKEITDEAMDENYPLQFNRIDCFFIKVPFSKVNYTICSNIMWLS
jgi:hypothetical protein